MQILRTSARSITLWVAILALTIFVFFPALSGGFYFDDEPNIVENRAIHIDKLNIESLKTSLNGINAGPLGRPVSVLSFALNHYLVGLDPFGFKAVNLAIHLVNGLLVTWLVRLLLQSLDVTRIPCSATTRTYLPYWVAAAWLVHPINFVAVTMAVQRMTLLSAMFTMLALIFHLKAIRQTSHSRIKWLLLSCAWLLFWPLAILSKENGLIFPMLVAVISFFSVTDSFSAEKARQRSTFVPLIAVLIIGLGLFWYFGLGWLDHGYAMRQFTLTERLMTETRVLWLYVAQIVVPSYSAFAIYLDDFSISKGILTPFSTLPSVIGWVLIIALTLLSRRRIPIMGFTAAWFLVGHSMESTFIPLEIAHEHRNYLPSIGLIFGFAYLGASMLGRIKMDHPKFTFSAAAIIPIALLGLFTWLRAEQASNPLTNTQIEATRHPESARANHAAALALFKSGYGDAGDPIGEQSIRFYLEQSEKLDPSFKLGYLSLIVWSCASNRPVEPKWLDSLAFRLQHTPFAPKDRSMPSMLLVPLVSMSKCLPRQDVLKLLLAGTKNARVPPHIRAQLFDAASDYELLVSHDVNSAKSFLESAIAVWPYDVRLKKKLFSYESVQIVD